MICNRFNINNRSASVSLAKELEMGERNFQWEVGSNSYCAFSHAFFRSPR
jgi:hypothetical protein